MNLNKEDFTLWAELHDTYLNVTVFLPFKDAARSIIIL